MITTVAPTDTFVKNVFIYTANDCFWPLQKINILNLFLY